jgi:hypothetical protein
MNECQSRNKDRDNAHQIAAGARNGRGVLDGLNVGAVDVAVDEGCARLDTTVDEGVVALGVVVSGIVVLGVVPNGTERKMSG